VSPDNGWEIALYGQTWLTKYFNGKQPSSASSAAARQPGTPRTWGLMFERKLPVARLRELMTATHRRVRCFA
jgi:hypothetical protein